MGSRRKSAKKSKTDPGMGPMLELLKNRPELVHALVFDPVKVKRLLRSRAAQILVPGVDVRKMLLRRVTGVPGGGPLRMMSGGYPLPSTAIPWIGGSIKAYCLKGTWLFCGRL